MSICTFSFRDPIGISYRGPKFLKTGLLRDAHGLEARGTTTWWHEVGGEARESTQREVGGRRQSRESRWTGGSSRAGAGLTVGRRNGEDKEGRQLLW
jgi:hypothetical protein